MTRDQAQRIIARAMEGFPAPGLSTAAKIHGLTADSVRYFAKQGDRATRHLKEQLLDERGMLAAHGLDGWSEVGDGMVCYGDGQKDYGS